MPADTSEATPMTSREQFAADCRAIALGQGATDGIAVRKAAISCHYYGNEATARVYRDDKIEIVADRDTLAMGINKIVDGKRVNPVVSLRPDGTSVRNHGEQAHLFEHAAALAGRTA